MGKIWERAKWDDEREEWHMPSLKPRPGFRQSGSISMFSYKAVG